MEDQVRLFAIQRENIDSLIGKLKDDIETKRFQEALESLAIVEDELERLEMLTDKSKGVQTRIVKDRALWIGSFEDKIRQGLDRREAGKKEDGNIAFKCNWNDKAYREVCSDEVYDLNKNQLHRSYCSVSQCRNFTGNGTPDDSACYESIAFKHLYFAAGYDHDERGKAIKPRVIWHVKKNHFAILTTIPPNWDSAKRIIIGMFWIDEVKEDPGKETRIFGDPERSFIDLMEHKLYFWDYYKNPNKPESQAWGQGLFRYVTNGAVLNILEHLRERFHASGGDTSKVDHVVDHFQELSSSLGSDPKK